MKSWSITTALSLASGLPVFPPPPPTSSYVTISLSLPIDTAVASPNNVKISRTLTIWTPLSSGSTGTLFQGCQIIPLLRASGIVQSVPLDSLSTLQRLPPPPPFSNPRGEEPGTLVVVPSSNIYRSFPSLFVVLVLTQLSAIAYSPKSDHWLKFSLNLPSKP
ncbi:hypothetical protein GW17_00057747 [Ensete ventricosum]|nr:hypothetical protein GW17_00057747 [Ensete ventricosum]